MIRPCPMGCEDDKACPACCPFGSGFFLPKPSDCGRWCVFVLGGARGPWGVHVIEVLGAFALQTRLRAALGAG